MSVKTAKAERLATTAGALLTIGDVCKILRVDRTTLWRWVRAGRFPAPDVALGRKFRRYRQSSVDAHLAQMSPGHGASRDD